MKANKVIHPKVVRGGAAVPLGDNYYYMTGNKHANGGIDIGHSEQDGIEVEDGEIMKMTPSAVKVFSSVPFLNGESPAQKVLKGVSPTQVFKEQQSFKQDNDINDDGSKKANGGKVMNRKLYATGGPKKPNRNILGKMPTAPKIGGVDNTGMDNIISGVNDAMSAGVDNLVTNPVVGTAPNRFQRIVGRVKQGVQSASEDVDQYFDDNPGTLGDYIGVGSNIIGSIIGNRANSKILDKMQYSTAPVARTAAKLKTNININPQLDKMRETAAAYERDVDNNTASSRVALARKQRGRMAAALNTNELYGNKENLETQLINQDKMNQQSVDAANLTDYNQWAQGKANFNNAIAEKRAENTIGLIDSINAGVQDVITRGEKRSASKDNMLTISASHPNVNPRILKDMGVKGITDKMVSDWDKANSKKKTKKGN